jgi:tRNA1(Val) A37 N6-methylase TrmN6
LFFTNINVVAEEEEIYLKAISDQIQVITKDLKTLEKAVYQKSDAVVFKPSSSNKFRWT